jgi:hypothetical protein
MNDRSGQPSDIPQSAYLATTMGRAFSLASKRGSALVLLDHVLFALLDDPDALALMEGCNADIASIRAEITDIIRRRTPDTAMPDSIKPRPSDQLRKLMFTSARAARETGRMEIDGAILLAALAGQTDTNVGVLLSRHGLKLGNAIAWLGEDPKKPARARRQVPEPAPAPIAPPRRQPTPPRAEPPPRRQPAPPRTEPPPRPAQRPAPADRGEAGPSLEEMLASIRDVMESEDDDIVPARDEAQRESARARRSPAGPAPAAPRPEERRIRTERPSRDDSVSGRAAGQAAPAEREAAKRLQARRSAPDIAQAPESYSDTQTVEADEKIVKFGKLVERIPRSMREGRAETIEVRIAREATDALLNGLEGRGSPRSHKIAVTRAMSLYLRAPDGGFMIEPLAPETQWIFDRPSFLDSEPFGRWRWRVMPTQRGRRRLQLVAAARSVDENGMIGDTALPEQVIEVRVRINWGRWLGKAVLWTVLAVIGGVLTQAAMVGWEMFLR